MKIKFGTDGIRGVANKYPITSEGASKFAMATARYFMLQKGKNCGRVVIGKDTRLSGYLLEYSMAAGFVAAGFDVLLVGPLPTPAVAMLVRSLRLELGIMISASHNHYSENGWKVFCPNGEKLTAEAEQEIERLCNVPYEELAINSQNVGKVSRISGVASRYIEFAKYSFPSDMSLLGKKIVVDAANGAGYKVIPTILRELGAEVIEVASSPNGNNINNGCGVLSLDKVKAKVKSTGAEIGFAFDGDADRVVVIDENGNEISGDHTIGQIAMYWKDCGLLKNNKMVINKMSNAALENYLRSNNIQVYRSSVGDKHVARLMKEAGCMLGGEQSGHIICGKYSFTGDAAVAALQILASLEYYKMKASSIVRRFRLYLQILQNVKYDRILSMEKIDSLVEGVSNNTYDIDKVLVRRSGTEPCIRVMVEGEKSRNAQSAMNKILLEIEKELASLR